MQTSFKPLTVIREPQPSLPIPENEPDQVVSDEPKHLENAGSRCHVGWR